MISSPNSHSAIMESFKLECFQLLLVLRNQSAFLLVVVKRESEGNKLPLKTTEGREEATASMAAARESCADAVFPEPDGFYFFIMQYSASEKNCFVQN